MAEAINARKVLQFVMDLDALMSLGRHVTDERHGHHHLENVMTPAVPFLIEITAQEHL
jgi:hypothetical protein